MSDSNHNGRPSVIEYETMSGVMVHVTPLSIFTIQSVRDKAEEMFPYPDPEPYRLPIENAVDPSIKQRAEENPEYAEVCKPVDEKRTAWRVQAYIDLGCSFPAFPTREALLAHFRPQIEAVRKYAVMGADEWVDVLNHCVFTGRNDKQIVVSLITQDGTIPLSPAEVLEGVRFFRVEVSGSTARSLARQRTRGAEEQS